jgi:hypothetical protein
MNPERQGEPEGSVQINGQHDGTPEENRPEIVEIELRKRREFLRTVGRSLVAGPPSVALILSTVSFPNKARAQRYECW